LKQKVRKFMFGITRKTCVCIVRLCTTSVHNTAQNSSDNVPSYLQTIIIAQMLSVGGKGGEVVGQYTAPSYTANE